MAGRGCSNSGAYNAAVGWTVRAITVDLDDTLWPFAPIGRRIERVLDEWMRTHSPATAAMFPVEAMRALREEVALAHPDRAHDMSAMRRMTLERALAESGGDVALAAPAYEAFFSARNQVECYPDSIDALARIAARVPVAAVTNGNADLEAIGLAAHVRFTLCAGDHGAAKPDPGIFLAACERLGVPPAELLHVGDHPEADVAGAARAGLRTCWINRCEDAPPATWPEAIAPPDLAFPTLAALADWLDAHLDAPRSSP
jgi:2-haloalkanoic acid dehalogenase type II